MQAPPAILSRLDLMAARPSVGGLMALCEENYAALLRLAPQLTTLRGRLMSSPGGRAELRLTIEDQARYTSTLRLTHFLRDADGASGQEALEPDALLRAYHDAEQVEVLSLRETVLPVLSHYDHPALAAKWRANHFLSKWLGYCLREGHRFAPGSSADLSDDRRELLSSA
jgi:uncharacterized protein YqiB (DUF1249 family)